MKLMISLKSSANIVESIQTNNKKTKKNTFIMKKTCIYPILGLKTRYFSYFCSVNNINVNCKS